MNPPISSVVSLNAKLFADDSVSEQWAAMWQMNFAPSKCHHHSCPFCATLLKRELLPGGVTQQIFIRGGYAPRSNPLPFYVLFFTKKVPLSFSFC